MIKDIYDSFMKVQGWVLAIIGIAVSAFTIYLAPNATIQVRIILPLICIFIIVIIVLVNTLFTLKTKYYSPKVCRCIEPYNRQIPADSILLIENFMLFTTGTRLLVFYKDDDFEKVIGQGVVITQQSDAKMQVGISLIEDEKSIITDLIKNKRETLSKIILKPFAEGRI